MLECEEEEWPKPVFALTHRGRASIHMPRHEEGLSDWSISHNINRIEYGRKALGWAPFYKGLVPFQFSNMAR